MIAMRTGPMTSCADDDLLNADSLLVLILADRLIALGGESETSSTSQLRSDPGDDIRVATIKGMPTMATRPLNVGRSF